ncbi:hypothetical protein ACLBWZ_11395 [Brucellaceae bacterium C25G]
MSNSKPAASESDKKRDNAIFLLPLFGALFSLPPILNLFTHRVLLFGIPLEFLYLLGVWTLMIVIAFFISLTHKKTSKHARQSADIIKQSVVKDPS